MNGHVKTQLDTMNLTAIDRLRQLERIQHKKGRRGKKTGVLLKNKIPIKTNHRYTSELGFFKADTIAHCGHSIISNFVYSLTFIDIVTCWTENLALRNKGDHGLPTQIKHIGSEPPFEIHGFDFDNSSEFLNDHLIIYFTDRPQILVKFTPSRPYRKNNKYRD